MGTRGYPQEVRTRALDLYKQHGPAEASRRLDLEGVTVKQDTISQWARRAGVVGTDTPARRQWVETRQIAWAERKLRLADTMGQVAEDALRVLADKIEDATPDQAARILGILVDRTQLLTGGATGRVETSNLDAEIDRLARELADVEPGQKWLDPEAAE